MLVGFFWSRKQISKIIVHRIAMRFV